MSQSPQSVADDSLSISSLSDSPQNARLSIPFKYRLPATTIGGSAVGLLLGISHGSRVTGLRFRAENAHRLPSSSTGWYLYHKSKNYHMALGGVKEGLKMGAKMSFWVGTFFTIEEAIDGFSGKRDFMSTTAAGLTVAGGFSAWSKSVVSYPESGYTEMVY